MVFIPAGRFRFMMDDSPTEKPVSVAAFCIDRTEVTTAAYSACVRNGKCSSARSVEDRCNAGVAGRENHPINCVNWDQATAYCKAQGKRLPTAKEWEYAARGNDGREYPWGDEEPTNQLCWDRDGEGKPNSTCAVGSYPAGRSPFGLDDMAGNVWEWTATERLLYYVSRGGGWYDVVPLRFRAISSFGYVPTHRGIDLGFRCASSPLP